MFNLPHRSTARATIVCTPSSSTNIRGQGLGLAAVGADARHVPLGLVAVDVDHQDARALRCQTARRRSTDPSGSAGDNRYLIDESLEISHRASVAARPRRAALRTGSTSRRADLGASR